MEEETRAQNTNVIKITVTVPLTICQQCSRYFSDLSLFPAVAGKVFPFILYVRKPRFIEVKSSVQEHTAPE